MDTHAMQQIKESVAFIQQQYETTPQYGIILGTGLGALVNDMEVEYTINYQDIPHFPISTVESHHGKLIFGTLQGKQVVVMQGRFHYYEGYTARQITFPVRVMKVLGIQRLFISNASGGLNPDHAVSDLMVMNDHINLHSENPLRGENLDELGPRFVDMYEPYDQDMIKMALAIGKEKGIRLHTGVYVSVTGPNLETPAEYKYLRIIGADAVGMSTIPEVIVARHMDLPVFAISVITDLGVVGKIEPISVEKVIAAAGKAEPNMTMIFKELIGRL